MKSQNKTIGSEITRDIEYYTAAEISAALKIGRNKAYQIIQDINKKLLEENPEAIIIRGRVSATYFRRFVSGTKDM